jgi:peroxin-2
MIKGTKEEESKTGELAFLPERTCAICYQDQNATATSEAEMLAASGGSGGVIGSAQTDITNPYETIPCGCIFCFVCLASRIEAEDGEGWVCLRCGEIVKECKPWNGDVLEEVPRTTTSKTVGFSNKLNYREEKTSSVKAERQTNDDSRDVENLKSLAEPIGSDISDDVSEGYEQDEDNDGLDEDI